MTVLKCNLLVILFIISIHLVKVNAQDYAEFARGAGMRRRNNRGPAVAAIASGLVGGVLGGLVMSQHLTKKHDKDRKELLQYIQLQDEVSRQRDKEWQKEYQKLYRLYEEVQKDQTERDYEEFKAPDTNNDDMISRSEFNTYVKKYLSSFPELSEKDFPKFDDFDLDGDGLVSFDEWQNFLYQQKIMEANNKKGKTDSNSAYADLVNALYDSTAKADSFNGVQKNMAAGAKGARRG